MSPLTEQQKAAIASIDRNVLVAAGAGSGKTHVLVERFIEILRSDRNARISDVIAVTYTKKAAAEMRSRIKSRIEELIAEKPDPAAAARWLSLRADVDAARIGTIHSLCESILRTHPAEAEIDPQFTVLDELEAAQLLRESVRRAMLETIAAGLPERQLMAAHPVQSVEDWLTSFLRASLRFDESIQVFGDGSAAAIESFAASLFERVSRLAVVDIVRAPDFRRQIDWLRSAALPADNKLEPVRQAVIRLAEEADRLCARAESAADYVAACSALRAMAGEINLRVGGASEEAKAVKASLRDLRGLVQPPLDDLPEAPDGPAAPAETGWLIALAGRARSHYVQAKKASQKLDFDDLIRMTHRLLTKSDSEAVKRYRQGLLAILVDEFQDTNGIQSELLSALAGEKTRLFLIGDDKQSIYKFQGADVSVFNRWLDRFNSGRDTGAGGGDGAAAVESLSVSFRSHPAVVDFVNRLFSRLLPHAEGAPEYRATFRPLSAFREADAGARVFVVSLPAPVGEEGGKAGRLQEAACVARWIEEKLASGLSISEKNGQARPAQLGDFAVLVQRNEDFRPLECEFARAGIRYVALGGAGFLERQEVLDMENLLRFIACPLDSHALLGVLRSPMFGLADDLLYYLSQQQGDSLWQKLAAAGGDDGLVGQTREILQALIAVARRRSLPDVVFRALSLTRYDVSVSASADGRQRSRNLWKLVWLADRHKHLSPLEFADRLQSMRALKVRQSAAPVDAGDSVKVMTVHGSKGLEFPVVLLPFLAQDAGRVAGKLLFHSEYGVAFDNSRQRNGEKPALYRLARFLERDMAVAEKKRLFYVAVTRARDYVCFFVDESARERESFGSWLLASLESAGPCLIEHAGSPPCGSLAGKGAWTAPAGDLCPAMLEPLPPVPGRESGSRLLRVTPRAGRWELPPVLVGRYFHALMERMAFSVGPLPEPVLVDVALGDMEGVAHPDLVAMLVEAGRRLMGKFLESELFALMKAAKRHLHEAPYVVLSPHPARKRPDLLLRDERGRLLVVDYKTDRFPPGDAAARADAHREQLCRYVADIEALTGETASAAVYFAEHGCLVWL